MTETKEVDTGISFRIVGQNVNGLADTKNVKNKAEKILMRLKSQADILFLQETHTTPAFESNFTKKYKDDKLIFSHGNSSSRGVMIVFNSTLEFTINKTVKDDHGR